ncbi:MAG: hypothetical protein KAR42_02460 [candidate division Zixibacteria bacterium]|nr:hypothetical protein [candidate division Zixibacteria bacterium]
MKNFIRVFIIAGMALVFIILGTQNHIQKSSCDSYFAKERKARLKGGKVPKKERRPNEWYYVQRAFPNSSIPEGKQLAAINAAKEIKATKQTPQLAGYDSWENVGPANIPGRITDLAGHSLTPNSVLAASASGGIFKLSGFGAEWTPIFDDAGVQSIGSIAIHPTDTNIIYVGTGEANNAGTSYEGTGVYKSIDGGATWVHKGLPNSYHIGRIVLDPSRPDTVFVAVMGKLFGTNPERGVYRSTDGGDTWEQKLFVSDSTGCIDIAVASFYGIENGLIACMMERVRDAGRRKIGGITSGVWHSRDMGDTWTDITGTGGLPPHSIDMGRIGVSAHPQYGYAALLFADTIGQYTGIYKASSITEEYLHWGTYDEYNELDELNGSWDGGWYFGNVRVSLDPTYVDRMFALGLSLYRKEGNYDPWLDIRNGQHVDMHAMWIDSTDGDRIFCGNDGGVYHSTDGGDSWIHDANMTNTQMYSVTIDPHSGWRIYGGSQDNGVMRNTNFDPQSWEGVWGGDGFYTIIDYVEYNTFYTESQYGYLVKTINNGDSWISALNGIDYDNDRHNWMTPIVMDPKNHKVLYYGSQFLYRTDDGAENWVKISPDLSNGDDPGNLSFGTITTIDVSRVNTDVIYVGTDDGNLHVSDNYGTNWYLRNTGLPNRWVTRVTPDPHDENVAYVTLSGYTSGLNDAHIYRTTDQGLNWIPIDGDLPDVPVNDIIVDYHDTNILYIATDVGVFVSENLGVNWILMHQGIPIVPVMDIDFHVPSRTLIAGTHGRSIYKASIYCPDLTDSDGDGAPDLCDNCPGIYNIPFLDADYDFIGDVCDECTDVDGDGYGDDAYPANTCPVDNCPSVYNPDQIDSNGDGIGDACAFRWTVFDTVETNCIRLIVGSNGNCGNTGHETYTMDYINHGDCDPTAQFYLYDGSPLLNYNDGTEMVSYYSMYSTDAFLQVTDMNFPVPTQTTADFDIYESGTFTTPDSYIGMERTWWAPKNPDSCNYVIQRMKLFSYDGLSHSGINICEVIDWDIPTDGGNSPMNRGGFDSDHHMIYTQGIEYDGVGCQPNDERYGGIAMLGAYTNDPNTIDTSIHPHSAYVVDNQVYLYPTSSWDPVMFDGLIQTPGYGVLSDSVDLSTVITYFYDYTITASDTLYIYSVLTTVQNASFPSSPDKSIDQLLQNIIKARQWTDDHIIPLTPVASNCGDANGDGTVNVGDAVFIINYAFKGGPAPNPLVDGDANCDGSCNVGDAVYLINYAFKGGPAPCANCP